MDCGKTLELCYHCCDCFSQIFHKEQFLRKHNEERGLGKLILIEHIESKNRVKRRITMDDSKKERKGLVNRQTIANSYKGQQIVRIVYVLK